MFLMFGTVRIRKRFQFNNYDCLKNNKPIPLELFYPTVVCIYNSHLTIKCFLYVNIFLKNLAIYILKIFLTIRK